MFRSLVVACSIGAVTITVLAAGPRIAPVATAVTDAQRALAAQYQGAFGNGGDIRTLLVHPELVKGVLPFAVYILAESTLPPRHRELLVLRTAWLARSEYVWAKHSSRAAQAGLSADEIARVAERSVSPRWNTFEAALLRAADELHRDSFVGEQTWQTLASRYGVPELMDATFTVAEMTMIAAVVNSVNVESEPSTANLELPTPNLQRPNPGVGVDMSGPRHPGDRTHMPLARPRIEPVVLADAAPEIRTMLDPSGSGRSVAAVYRTFARHPGLYAPRQILSEYIRTKSTLSPRVREMLILRIGWRCRSAYEWAAHAPAGRRAGLSDDQIRMLARDGYDGWSTADAAIVRAADELFDDDTISDRTWAALDEQFDERQLLDLLITTGGYRMVSMVLNTFGVPAEPNSEPLPSRTP